MDTGPDGPLQERLERAQAQTAQLRARLAGLAHTLSGSYEELARQNDQLARNRRPPVQFDHAAAAKSWRALAETALLTARAWEAAELSLAMIMGQGCAGFCQRYGTAWVASHGATRRAWPVGS